MRHKSSIYNWIILISFPFLLYGTILIMPTFDDWNTLSSPNNDPYFLKYFLPFGSFWRPFDALMGYINSMYSPMFPTLNHILICIAHLYNTYLVYIISKKLSFSHFASNIAAAFFYFSPCMLATVLSVDALNQSYSQLFSLLSVYFYITSSGNKRYVLWLSMVLCATLSKENGLAWSLIAPIIAFSFYKISRQQLKHDISLGLIFAAIYIIIRLLLPHTVTGQNEHFEEFISLNSKISGLAKWIIYTWTATDVIALVHSPSRNVILVLVTTFLSLPFIIIINNIKTWKERQTIGLLVTFLISALPNLIIAMSLMNTYCSLALAALIIGWMSTQSNIKIKNINILFTFYLLAAFITDIHHWYMAWTTSLPGIRAAKEVVEKTGTPVERAYNISIKDNYQKYSSFCVPFDEAYGWGRSVLQVTDYKWPEEIDDTTINIPVDNSKVLSFAHNKLNNGYDCVWIVSKDRVEVIRK